LQLEDRLRRQIVAAWIVASVLAACLSAVLYAWNRERLPESALTNAGVRLGDVLDVKANGRSVAVLPFQSSDGSTSGLGAYCAQMVASVLARRPSTFKLVDRSHLHAVLEEHKLAASALVDPRSAGRLGRLQAAQVLVTGTVYSTPGGLFVRLTAVEAETGAIVSAESLLLPTTRTLSALLNQTVALPSSQVSVPPVNSTSVADTSVDFFVKNWPWLWSVLIVPGFAWLARRAWRKRGSAESQVDSSSAGEGGAVPRNHTSP
jgi:hypothetical protein